MQHAPPHTIQASRHADLIARVCRLIEAADTPPGLHELAAAVQLSPYHLHRVFKAQTGLTPRAYADAHRVRRLREALSHKRTVIEAAYEAGFQSGARMYARSASVLGMPPADYRAGGRRATIRFAVGESSLGAILVACSERGVCAILMGDAPQPLVQDLQDRFPLAELIGDDAGFAELVARVVGFVEAPRTGLDLPLDVQGTAFQQRVWQLLQTIPAGSTMSYSDIARQLGEPRAARAVAGACAANALALAIPCHRVVRSDGALSGYRWGVERKRELLEREARP